ncbi:uncharacterized protein LOC114270468 isoform X1 [Camellia sinensis]|uniref:uncharacterized protein LOC114270468 isoform X1 n=1 Tax=Camellia sinensis TaxID=4442 RepID=UPI001035DEE4|nr:uncharacterized protein LOC114270468 isoform X1 [Camellia sinensis]
MTNYVRVMLREKEKEMGAGSLMNYAVEKSKELPAVVGNMGADLMGKAEEKWKELAPNMGGDLMGKVDEMFPPETIKEQIQRFIQHLIQVCQHLIQVCQPYIIPAIAAGVLIILLCCCGALFINIIILIIKFVFNIIKSVVCCFGRGTILIIKFVFNIIKSVFSCFGRGTVSGGKAIKMMIAPGTRGARVIVRSVFESNPAAYFSGLRGR